MPPAAYLLLYKLCHNLLPTVKLHLRDWALAGGLNDCSATSSNAQQLEKTKLGSADYGCRKAYHDMVSLELSVGRKLHWWP